MATRPPRVDAKAHDAPRVNFAGPAPTNVLMVAEAMRDAIVEGRFAPGERIKEIPLAKQLGLSRGPIRDALRLLQHDGLVDILPNRGAIVPEVRAADVLEVYAVRATLGSLALQKLLLADPEATIRPLETALRRFERAVERGHEPQAVAADLLYQSTIVKLAGLPRVLTEFERLTWHLRMFIATLDIHYDDRLGVILEEHQALHEAIVARRAEAAQQLWRDRSERWVRFLIDRLPDAGFDAGLWVALTSGTRR